jgi:MGT family glycosyltransferase
VTRRLNILFVQADCGGGVPPATAVARRLRERGHAVRFLAARSLKSQLTQEGFSYEAFQRAPDFGSARRETDQLRDWEARTPIGAVHALFNVMCGPAGAHAADLLDNLEATPTDVIACDFMLLGAFVGAEACHVPSVALVHTVAVVPLDGLPPIPYGLKPAHGLPGRSRDAFLRAARDRLLRRWLDVLNDARARYELAPVARIHDQWFGAQRLLILSSSTFDFPANHLPDNVRYTGPPFCEAPADTPPELSGPSQAPLVLASLSTTYQDEGRYLRILIAALGSLPVQAIVTTGAGYDLSDLDPLPGNVDVRPYIPHGPLLDRAAIMITHSGHGSVIAALAHGVPLLCVPFARDQRDIALRAVATGAAVRLHPTRLSTRKLARTVERVLQRPEYRQAARRIQANLATEDGAGDAAREIAAVGMGSARATRLVGDAQADGAGTGAHRAPCSTRVRIAASRLSDDQSPMRPESDRGDLL